MTEASPPENRPAGPPLLPLPPSPCRDCLSPGRRRFLVQLSLWLGSLAAALVAIPSVGFLLGLRRPTRVWRDVGAVDQFALGATVQVAFLDPSPLPWAGVTAQTAAWLRRVDANRFLAFSVDCTHLGCPIRWLADANLFMCPCHGGVFYADGRVASGPPPRPLTQYPVRVAEGRVQILASPLPIT
ncbi:MAG TPA: Rieske (2Fe-2S) protein [Terriglobales bacterium]|nr:Rieske (2Fe-2S) protein [Terriglobales bacterium]